MKEVIKLFKQIQETSSTNDKKAIIFANKNNELFKKCLVFLLDRQPTGLSAKKIKKKVIKSDYILPTFEDVMKYLAQNNTGTDNDISMIQAFLDEHEEDREFYEQMIIKSFRLGADSKVVNSVIPGLIPTWEVQQAYPLSEKNEPKDGEWFALSQKLNGCFTYNARIDMADGSKKNISKINIGDEIISFDEYSNKLCYKKVTNVFHNGNKTDWIKIKCGHSKSHICSYNVTATPIHKFFTNTGWKEAQELVIGDELYVKDYVISDEQKSVLIGLGLGDGSVYLNDDGVRFTYVKEETYKNYFDMIFNMFGEKSKYEKDRISGYGSRILKMHINTITSAPEFMNNHLNIIRSGYTFTEEILNNLTPLALAVYYIDDGSKLPSRSDGEHYNYCKNIKPRATFATHRHEKKAVELFSNYLLSEYGIENRIVKYKDIKLNGDNGYQIEMTTNGTKKLYDIIAPYIPYELRKQKLGSEWQNVKYINWEKQHGNYELINKKITNIEKMNGVRASYDLEIEDTHTYFANGFAVHNCNASYYKGKLITRQGKEFTGLQHIIDDIQKLPKHENFFFNGELIRKNIDNLPDDQNFQIGTGIINSDNEDKSCIYFKIYEVLPVEEFEKGESKLTYKDRRNNVLNPLSVAINRAGLENIKVVPIIYEGTDKSKIQELLNQADSDGWEGLMLNKDTKWKNKRNNGILKVKSFKHADILCTDVVEGDGKYKGTLGLIKCDYKGYELGVGSGFSDQQRSYYWNHKSEIIGKIVQIKYKGETKNKQGGLSVQFPIFEIVRDDKTEPSYN